MKLLRIGVVGLIAIGIMLFSARPASAVIITIDDPNLPNPFVPATPLPPNQNFPDLSFSEFNLNQSFKDLYGNASPNQLPDKVGFGENQTLFALILAGGGEVKESQTVGFVVTGDFWTVKSTLTFNPATAIIVDPNDELTLSGFVIHNGTLSAPNIPHEGDDASGPQLDYSVTINAGNKMPFDIFGPAVGNGVTVAGEHPHSGHVDIARAALFGRVASSSFLGVDVFDDITRWTGAEIGAHVVPEPSSLLLLGCGLLGLAGWRRRKQAASREDSDTSSVERG